MTEQPASFTSLVRTLLRPERNFWWLMLIYGIAVSILGLSVPLSVQVLISSVVNAALVNQVVVLAVILFVILTLSAFFIAVQNYLMELFERRYFARVMSEVALRLLHAAQSSLRFTNRADLVNRYFDIMSVQKSMPPLLTGGLATALQSIAGLVLTSFYHPAFLIFNVVTVLAVYLAYRVFDRPAGRTAVALSTAKYDAASWLEEIARSNTFFQTQRGMRYAIERTEVVEVYEMLQVQNWCAAANDPDGSKRAELGDAYTTAYINDRIRLLRVRLSVDDSGLGQLESEIPLFDGSPAGFFHNKAPLLAGLPEDSLMQKGRDYLRSLSAGIFDPNAPDAIGGGQYFDNPVAVSVILQGAGCDQASLNDGDGAANEIGRALEARLGG